MSFLSFSCFFNRWRKDMFWFRFQGEAASVDLQLVVQGRKDFQAMLVDYAPDNIFNLDEAALFWKLLPDRTFMIQRGEHGTKRSKSRITVVLITNMSGTEKLTPIVIGKSKCPRCWTKKRISSLPVQYKSTSKAWMVSHLFEAVLLDINSQMRKKGRKIILIVDGAGLLISHLAIFAAGIHH